MEQVQPNEAEYPDGISGPTPESMIPWDCQVQGGPL